MTGAVRMVGWISRGFGGTGTCDVFLCHPFVVHTATWPHRGTQPRTMAQPGVAIEGGFALDGTDPSPVAEMIMGAWPRSRTSFDGG